MPSHKLAFAVIFLYILAVSSVIDAQTVGKLFTVDSTADANDAVPGDRICADTEGRCTLRAAVQEANTNTVSGRDIIIFGVPIPAVIDLTLGPLTITGTNISIVGPGARRLTVQRSASQAFRIFHIPNTGTNTVIRGLTIRDGLSGQLIPGGGLRVGPGCSVSLYDTVFLNNAGGSGGAIENEGTLSIMRSLIVANTAGFQGGGIHSTAGSTTRIFNSTITNNEAPTGGGVWNAGSMVLVNDTISHNDSKAAANSIFNDPNGSIHALNAIIAGNPSSTVASMSGAFTSMGNNLVTDARNTTGFANGVNGDKVSDNNAIDPLLGALSDNGGQTDTRMLQGGSPAIDAGNGCIRNASCPLPIGPTIVLRWDQRVLYSRPFIGTVDIGSVEFGAIQVTGIGGFTGSFSPGIGLYQNSVVILTDTETNEKRYAAMGPLGTFRFQNHRPGVVYVQEIRSKRFLLPGPTLLPIFD